LLFIYHDGFRKELNPSCGLNRQRHGPIIARASSIDHRIRKPAGRILLRASPNGTKADPSDLDHMVRIGSRTWTPAQITHLMVLIDEGSSAAVIAVSLKRSITVIRAKARNLGKPFPMIAPLMVLNGRSD
jgi:hypothetical protein